MPNRYIREAAIESEGINSLSWIGEVFFRRLLNRVDDFGRYSANPALIRARLFPLQLAKVREAEISRLLAQCEKAGLLFAYSVNSKAYLIINRWEKGRAKRSVYPEPPPDICKHMLTYVFTSKQMLSYVPDSDSDSDSDADSDADADADTDTDSRSGGVKCRALIPSQQPELICKRMLAINALKRRGDGTAWSAKEFAAFQAMGLHQIPDEDFTAQIEPLAYYYGASASSLREMWRTTDEGADFRRRDLLTLLHNFSGECDRAREWTEFQRKKIELRDAGRLGSQNP